LQKGQGGYAYKFHRVDIERDAAIVGNRRFTGQKLATFAEQHCRQMRRVEQPAIITATLYNSQLRMEPTTGFEPVTCGLRNRCSTS
jgi:hypothetical protein